MTRISSFGLLALCAAIVLPPAAWTQAVKKGATSEVPLAAALQQPDAQRTKEELSNLLQRYPPSLRNVLSLDPTLLGNSAYLQPYPALTAFLGEHPEIERNPSFYLGDPWMPHNRDASTEMMGNILGALAAFAGFGMAIGLLVWLIRTLVDYYRWSRLAKVQADVHGRLLDRFSNNEELLAYMQSPAGAKFLESAPIALDSSPRSVGAPLGRILWSVQGGVVLIAAGAGLQFLSTQVTGAATDPLHALGVLALALGLGFVASAIISYFISRRLGLIPTAPRPEAPRA
jgi:hypothetical protein